MKVALVTASLSRNAGGLYFSVSRMAKHLAAPGKADVQVLGIEDANTQADLPAWDMVVTQPFRRIGPAFFGCAPGMSRALRQSNYDLAHTQGLWMYPSHVVHRWARATGHPYMVTPHGMLDPWAVQNSRWKKRLAGWAYEYAHLHGAACLHALCHAEAEAIRAFGLCNPVCVIPNGIDLPDHSSVGPPVWAKVLPPEVRVLLYLGRLHPKKGLPGLIEAWRLAQGATQRHDWHLVIAGWDQGGHQAELAAQVEHAGLQGQVHFVGPQFGPDKAASYSRADAFVLPSFSEGLPMVVLEAWAHRLPVLMTPECHLPEGLMAGAAIEMAADPDAIANALQRHFAMPDEERRAMGERGRALVERCFNWAGIAQQMLSVYQWLLGDGSKPDFVLLD